MLRLRTRSPRPCHPIPPPISGAGFACPTDQWPKHLALGLTLPLALPNWAKWSSAPRTLWRYARYTTDTGVTDKRVRGPLIERRRPIEAVVLLELQQRPLCPRARDTVERAMVESNSVKLYLRPPDIILREICGIDPMVRRYGRRIRIIISVGYKIQGSATDPQRQYRSRTKGQFSDHSHLTHSPHQQSRRSALHNTRTTGRVPSGRACQIWGGRVATFPAATRGPTVTK